MAENDVMQHEPAGIRTRSVVLITAGFLSLVVLAIVLVGIMFGVMQASRGPVAVEFPIVRDQPRLQVRPIDDLVVLRRMHETQLEAGPVPIEEAMKIVAGRADPLAPLSEAERAEAAR